jgi:hypothetical protein
MAEQKKTYPMLPTAHWWALRKKFKQSIPGVVTDGYLATVLQMQANSARANVLPYLKDVKIIDNDGKTGDRAKQWRDDARYPAVCKEILEEVYPAELRDAVTDSSERDKAESWFAHETGTGEAAAGRMAQFYTLLLEADPAKQTASEKSDKPKKATKLGPKAETKPAATLAVPAPGQFSSHQQFAEGPGIHINLEVHISADSTPDQIDAIFASMAKHIYKRG